MVPFQLFLVIMSPCSCFCVRMLEACFLGQGLSVEGVLVCLYV